MKSKSIDKKDKGNYGKPRGMHNLGDNSAKIYERQQDMLLKVHVFEEDKSQRRQLSSYKFGKSSVSKRSYSSVSDVSYDDRADDDEESDRQSLAEKAVQRIRRMGKEVRKIEPTLVKQVSIRSISYEYEDKGCHSDSDVIGLKNRKRLQAKRHNRSSSFPNSNKQHKDKTSTIKSENVEEQISFPEKKRLKVPDIIVCNIEDKTPQNALEEIKYAREASFDSLGYIPEADQGETINVSNLLCLVS